MTDLTINERILFFTSSSKEHAFEAWWCVRV